MRTRLVTGGAALLCLFAVLAAGGATASAKDRSDRIMERLLEKATPGQIQRLIEMPRDDGRKLNPKDVEVPPTINPTLSEGIIELKEFVDANSNYLSNLIEKGREKGEKEPVFPERYEEEYIPGIGYGQVGTDGSIRVRRPDGSFRYTEEVPSARGSDPGSSPTAPTPDAGSRWSSPTRPDTRRPGPTSTGSGSRR